MDLSAVERLLEQVAHRRALSARSRGWLIDSDEALDDLHRGRAETRYSSGPVLCSKIVLAAPVSASAT